MKKASLFDIIEEIRALDDLIDDVEGDVTGSEEILNQFFAETDTALEKKVEGYCKIIKEKEAIAKARKEEAKRIIALAKVDENRAKMLKNRLKDALDELGLKRIETLSFKVSVAKNGGKIPFFIDDEKTALEKFGVDVKTLTADAKEALRKAVEAGDENAVNLAHFGERGTSLRIK